MSDEKPNFPLSEPENEPVSKFPWLWIGMLVVVFALAAVFIVQRKSGDSKPAQREALEQQLTQIKSSMDESRDQVFDITERLNALKQAIALRQVTDRESAVAEYNKLAAEQRAQREKVKEWAEEYNQKLAQFNALQ